MKKTRSSQKALRCIISVTSLLLALMVVLVFSDVGKLIH